MRETDLDQLTAHAARNGGIVSIADCRRAGLLYSEVAARCRSGAWPRLARGTYLLDADLRSGPSRADPVRAAISSFGSDAVIGLHTAAELHGIGGAPSSPMVHIITPRTAGRGRGVLDPIIKAHQIDLGDDDVTVIGGMAVTTAARTLMDLVSCLDRFSRSP